MTATRARARLSCRDYPLLPFRRRGFCFEVSAKKIDQCTQRGQILPPAWVVQEKSLGRWRYPGFQQGDQLPSCYHRRSKFFENVKDARAAQCGLNQKAGFVGDQRALDLNLDDIAFDGEPPRQECAAWKAQADAIVRVQVLRFYWPRMPRQVVRRSNDDNAHVVGHTHRDHVARNAVTETNPGVISAGDDVGSAQD